MVDVSVGRVYDDEVPRGTRVLVDRLWPRGVSKAAAPFDEWCKEVAPSTELRTWYGHDPERFATFRTRYLDELAEPERAAALEHLRDVTRSGRLVLMTATRDTEISAAAVLADLLRG
jgi:uncharacterized protein YeaO (DUF488 family)